MTLAKIIEEQIQAEYKAEGKTHKDIAKAHNVSPSYIQALLAGERDWDKLKIGTISKMFPRATLNLNGDGSIMQTVAHVSAKNGSVNNISLNPATPSEAQIRLAVDAFRHEVVDALIGLDIPPDALAAVLKTIKELAPKGTAQ